LGVEVVAVSGDEGDQFVEYVEPGSADESGQSQRCQRVCKAGSADSSEQSTEALDAAASGTGAGYSTASSTQHRNVASEHPLGVCAGARRSGGKPAHVGRGRVRLLDKDPARRPQNSTAALAALPQAPAPPGRLAAEAWRAQQARSQHAATQGRAMSAAEIAAAERRQALADLSDLCASVDEQARRDVPDLRWDDHGDIQRLSVDDVRVEFILWRTIQDRDGLILVGEVSTVVSGARRCAANIVCERSGDHLRWFLDTVTRTTSPRVVEVPGGFEEEAEFFIHYDHLQRGGQSATQRRHLTVDAVLDLLGDLLEAS
jgi:hypothetical protein